MRELADRQIRDTIAALLTVSNVTKTTSSVRLVTDENITDADDVDLGIDSSVDSEEEFI